MNTRSQSQEQEPEEDWVLGRLIEDLVPIPSCQLPTNGDVIRNYVYLSKGPMRLNKKEEVILQVLKNVEPFWNVAGIKCQDIRKNDPPKKKLRDLIQEYLYIKKNKDNEDYDVFKKANFYKNILGKLFDIAARDAEKTIENDKLRSQLAKEEDLQFLADQRSERKFVLGSVDRNYTRKIENKEIRMKRAEKYKTKVNESSENEIRTVTSKN